MVRIRMQRMGRTHRPFYRINAIEKRNPRDGEVLENLGWYNPIEKDESKQVVLKADRIQHWISTGAQPSESVWDLLRKHEVVSEEAYDEWLKGAIEEYAGDPSTLPGSVKLASAE